VVLPTAWYGYFVASYLVINHGWLKVPNVAVVLLSMGFWFRVLGLSYGVLSASWDEEMRQ